MRLSVRVKGALALGALYGLVACSVFGTPSGKKILVADHYFLVIPQDYSAKQVSDVEDFQVFRISDRDGKSILQAYFGNQPQTALAMGDGERIAAGAFSGALAEKKKDGKWFGEVLFQIDPDGWPSRMHAKFSSLDSDQHQKAISIIRSLRKQESER